MTYLQKAENLYAMINGGKLMEAFEKYYAEDVVMQEVGEPERVGKAVNRAYEEKFVTMIKEVHGGGVNNFTSNEATGVTMVENWMDVTFQDGNRVNIAQVCVQTWNGDQIIKEVFYHK